MSPPTRRQALIAGASTLAITGCIGGSDRALPVAPIGEWDQRAHDARNTGASDVEVPSSVDAVWDQGEAHLADPVISDELLFSVSNEATALNAQSGELRWDSDLDGKASHTPALLNDKLFVATKEPPHQQLLALHREDGSKEWVESLPAPAGGAVTAIADPHLITVPLGSSALLAYDPQTGDQLWQEAIVGARKTAVIDDTVYVTGYQQDGETGVLRALEVTDGSRRWETELDHPDTPPIVTNEGLLVGDGGTLAIYDATNGTHKRDLGTFGERIHPEPAVADDTVFVPVEGGGLEAVTIGDGSVEWRNDVPVTADTGVTLGQETVVAPVTNLPGDDHAGIAAFQQSDGSRRWGYPIEGFHAGASTSAVLADGAVFYSSNESSGVVALGDL